MVSSTVGDGGLVKEFCLQIPFKNKICAGFQDPKLLFKFEDIVEIADKIVFKIGKKS